MSTPSYISSLSSPTTRNTFPTWSPSAAYTGQLCSMVFQATVVIVNLRSGRRSLVGRNPRDQAIGDSLPAPAGTDPLAAEQADCPPVGDGHVHDLADHTFQVIDGPVEGA